MAASVAVTEPSPMRLRATSAILVQWATTRLVHRAHPGVVELLGDGGDHQVDLLGTLQPVEGVLVVVARRGDAAGEPVVGRDPAAATRCGCAR